MLHGRIHDHGTFLHAQRLTCRRTPRTRSGGPGARKPGPRRRARLLQRPLRATSHGGIPASLLGCTRSEGGRGLAVRGPSRAPGSGPRPLPYVGLTKRMTGSLVKDHVYMQGRCMNPILRSSGAAALLPLPRYPPHRHGDDAAEGRPGGRSNLSCARNATRTPAAAAAVRFFTTGAGDDVIRSPGEAAGTAGKRVRVAH